MKKLRAIALVAIVCAFVVIVLLNPLRHSEDKIRASLLNVTPIGSTFDFTVARLKEAGYSHLELEKSHGFLKQDVYPSATVGVSSIHVHLGDYRNFPIPLATDVDAFWGFDERGKLLDVWIWKTTDGL